MKNIINLFLPSRTNLIFVLGKLGFIMTIVHNDILVRSKTVLFDSSSQNFLKEIQNFCNGFYFEYCDIIFDVPEQLFTVKTFSSQLKGKSLNYIIKTKLDSELPENGIKGFKQTHSLSADESKEYILCWLDTSSEVAKAVFAAIARIGVKPARCFSLYVELSDLSVSKDIRAFSVSKTASEDNMNQFVAGVDASVNVINTKIGGVKVFAYLSGLLVYIKDLKYLDLNLPESTSLITQEIDLAYSYLHKTAKIQKSKIVVNLFDLDFLSSHLSGTVEPDNIMIFKKNSLMEYAGASSFDRGVLVVDDFTILASIIKICLKPNFLIAIPKIYSAFYQKRLLDKAFSVISLFFTGLTVVSFIFLIYYFLHYSSLDNKISPLLAKKDAALKTLNVGNYLQKSAATDFYAMSSSNLSDFFAKVLKIRSSIPHDVLVQKYSVSLLSSDIARVVIKSRTDFDLSDSMLGLRSQFGEYEVKSTNFQNLDPKQKDSNNVFYEIIVQKI